MNKEKLDLSIWVTPSQLAKDLKVKISRVTNWILRGKIDTYQISPERKLVNKNTIRVKMYKSKND